METKLKKKKITIIASIIMLICLIGVTYAFFIYAWESIDQVMITDDVYMNFAPGSNGTINLSNVIPMTKEEALLRNDNIFDFTITGKNSTSKDIYYGISLIDGETIPAGKSVRINRRDIDVYLKSGNDVLVDGERFNNFDGTNIYINKIAANTASYSKSYSLRIWIDEGVAVYGGELANTEGGYTEEEWASAYVSLKVRVDANMSEMNIPLTVSSNSEFIEDDQLSTENGKSYFIATISNFFDMTKTASNLTTPDEMNLKVTSTNSDIKFSYTELDSNNQNTTIYNNLKNIDLDYNFETDKETKKIKVFLENVNDETIESDIKVSLTKNSTEVYEITRRMLIKGYNYCLNNGYSLKDCILVNEIRDLNEPTDKTIKSAKTFISNKGSVNVDNVATTSEGMYKVEDDIGDSYFYRGAVTNNNVKFGNFYWKIVRVNGDGSIRLIYNGETLDANGNIGKDYSANNNLWTLSVNNSGDLYNSLYADPAYVGYMYGEDYENELVEGAKQNYTYTNGNSIYFFSDYTYNQATRTFSPAGEKVSKTLAEMKTLTEDNNPSTLGIEVYKYTCRSTSATGECQNLEHVISIPDANNYEVKYMTYPSKSYAGTITNTTSSTIKNRIDTWYDTNIKGKVDGNGISYDSYINEDAIFCNDRSFASDNNGNGYSISTFTTYASYERIYHGNTNGRTASLKCSQKSDKFSKTSTYGNGKLINAVALITADEVALAGGKYNTNNRNYYLYTGNDFFTMSPYFFHARNAYASIWSVLPSGSLNYNSVAKRIGVRAVINLNSNVLVATGDGSVAHPYEVKLS